MNATLDQLSPGGYGTVTAIHGGPGLRRNLQRMGIHVGDRLRVAGRGAFRGPLLVEIHGSRIALGRGVARRVEVATEEAPPARGHRRWGRRRGCGR
jgi:ferrous iron transport protein A